MSHLTLQEVIERINGNQSAKHQRTYGQIAPRSNRTVLSSSFLKNILLRIFKW